MTANVATVEQRIAERIDSGVAGGLTVSGDAGGLAFANAGQAMEFAKMMAISSISVPKHLRGNPGACLAVVIQAIEWRLSPYAVANKSYSVNDRLAYESQLVQAVILQRAPIKGRFKVEFTGEGSERVCRVWAELRETGDIVDYVSPPFGQITPKNSPLWKSDPDQQHFYYSGRALCRRHFPDVLLGVYARDEIEEGQHVGPDKAKDVTPLRTIGDKLDALAAVPEREKSEKVDTETGEVTEEQPTAVAAEPPTEPTAAAVDLATDQPATTPAVPDAILAAQERGRADCRKGVRRLAPTALSKEEREAYLAAYDDEREAMAEAAE